MTETASPARAPASAPSAVMTVAGLLAFEVAVLGGSSRYDAIQLIALLPLSCLVAGYCLATTWSLDWARVRVPAILLLAWTVLTLLQLVPLPPDVWHALPGRAPMVAVAEAIGDERWRPLSMAPWRTEHALWALSVPMAALLVFVALRDRAISFAIFAMIAIATASGLLGILQISTGGDSVLYFYDITNPNTPVGLFANRNHTAMFNATIMIVIAATARAAPRPLAPWHLPALGAAFFTLLMCQFINGSRAGMGLTLLALVFSALIMLQASREKGNKRAQGGLLSVFPRGDRRIAVLLFGIALALGALFFFADRLPGLSAMIEENPLADLRYQLTPIVSRMVWLYFPWGIGFGAFENVFYIHEPTAMLGPSYVNQAHNDLLQTVLEGGLPALAIILAMFFWSAHLIRSLILRDADSRVIGLAAVGVGVLLVFGSGADYPLRAPLFQMVAVWLVCIFATLAASKTVTRSEDSGSSMSFPPEAVDARRFEKGK